MPALLSILGINSQQLAAAGRRDWSATTSAPGKQPHQPSSLFSQPASSGYGTFPESCPPDPRRSPRGFKATLRCNNCLSTLYERAAAHAGGGTRCTGLDIQHCDPSPVLLPVRRRPSRSCRITGLELDLESTPQPCIVCDSNKTHNLPPVSKIPIPGTTNTAYLTGPVSAASFGASHYYLVTRDEKNSHQSIKFFKTKREAYLSLPPAAYDASGRVTLIPIPYSHQECYRYSTQARSMRAASAVPTPPALWAEAVQHAAWIDKRLSGTTGPLEAPFLHWGQEIYLRGPNGAIAHAFVGYDDDGAVRAWQPGTTLVKCATEWFLTHDAAENILIEGERVQKAIVRPANSNQQVSDMSNDVKTPPRNEIINTEVETHHISTQNESQQSPSPPLTPISSMISSPEPGSPIRASEKSLEGPTGRPQRLVANKPTGFYKAFISDDSACNFQSTDIEDNEDFENVAFIATAEGGEDETALVVVENEDDRNANNAQLPRPITAVNGDHKTPRPGNIAELVHKHTHFPIQFGSIAPFYAF
ncbi:hypothetical protein FISHEDRAFT_75872 [Fistulina hepatica ATCC 64428]|uniref:Uncharacterized protein n=1 Tax=Fistulina hepatica ATCC 64428 TaxID=1128425 RepID=A0A0D7A6M0_9AGAR|nr:hypothetical protein FISHEDRAFT_75872 [Fistulina hepatica ATCC 64428]